MTHRRDVSTKHECGSVRVHVCGMNLDHYHHHQQPEVGTPFAPKNVINPYFSPCCLSYTLQSPHR
jgi:hypothetical protein